MISLAIKTKMISAIMLKKSVKKLRMMEAY